jgi:small GTP-binding protein
MISKKVVLLGHFGVGKTSLIRRFVENVFTEDYKVSIGVHILKKEVEFEAQENVSLILWDLEGADDIESFRKSYLLGSHAFIYVFDATRPTTNHNINTDIDYLSAKYKTAAVKVVGNKTDLIDKSGLEEILKEHQINSDYLTSAKTGENVDLMFATLAKELTQ